MMHAIFDNEIRLCQDAAGKLLTKEGEPRSLYQTIFHVLEGCKDRFLTRNVDADGYSYCPQHHPHAKEMITSKTIDYLRESPLYVLMNGEIIWYTVDDATTDNPYVTSIAIRYRDATYVLDISKITETRE